MMPIGMDVIEQQALKVRPFVYSKIPSDDALDVMQDIRIALFLSLPTYRGDATLDVFIGSIARRKVADYWRRQYRHKKTISALSSALRRGQEITPGQNDRIRIKSLSHIEQRIFQMIGRGLSNDEISSALFRTKNTVRSHIKSIYRKFGVNGRAKLAILAYQIYREEK